LAARTDAASAAVVAGRAVLERSRSVLGTAIGLAVAAVPVVALGQRPGAEMLRPMAFAVWGGLVSWVVVTLIGLPAAFVLLAGRSEERRHAA
jgi:HME family heavy-metal exporter